MGSVQGVERTAAARTGVTVEVYRANLAKGLKWCHGCRVWKMREQFGIDRHRGDGLHARCFACRRVTTRRRSVGGPPNQAVATKAMEAVRRAVRLGFLEPVRSRVCSDCGQPAAHYHHHLGYDREHWLDVVPLCRRHHKLRHLD